MTDQPLSAEYVDSARALYDQASKWLALGFGPEANRAPLNVSVDACMERARICAQVAHAGTGVAKVLLLQEEITQALKAEEELRHAITGSRE